MMRVRHLTLFVFFALSSGCATVVPKEIVNLEPLVIRSDSSGRVESFQARQLFESASKDYQERRYAEAAKKFLKLVKFFGESKYGPHGLFNAGLSYMKLKKWKLALTQLTRAHDALKGTADEWDALLQIASCNAALGNWPATITALKDVLASADLTIVDRIETQIRLGLAYYQSEALARAEKILKRALEVTRKNNEIPRLHRNKRVANARYVIGEIYRDLFRSIKFRLPVETMERDLVDKSSFFLKAQSAYLKCVRIRNPEFSVAAGFQLGKLYEDMFDDMMAAEIPKELNADDRKIYFDELKKHVKPLVLRAIDIYERNLSMSDRLGNAAGWAQKTQKSLERMRDILRDEFTEIPASN